MANWFEASVHVCASVNVLEYTSMCSNSIWFHKIDKKKWNSNMNHMLKWRHLLIRGKAHQMFVSTSSFHIIVKKKSTIHLKFECKYLSRCNEKESYELNYKISSDWWNERNEKDTFWGRKSNHSKDYGWNEWECHSAWIIHLYCLSLIQLRCFVIP